MTIKLNGTSRRIPPTVVYNKLSYGQEGGEGAMINLRLSEKGGCEEGETLSAISNNAIRVEVLIFIRE